MTNKADQVFSDHRHGTVSNTELVKLVSSRLAEVADPAKAGPMAAYMKTDMPFYGVSSPLRRPIAKEIRERFPPAGNDEYRGQVTALWELPHREEKYLALDIATARRRFITFENIDLYERLIRGGAWWDFVDEVAAHLVGRVVLIDRPRMRPILEAWINDPDMWIRRTAILCQTRHKNNTDTEMLFDFCRRRAHEKEFFIRKAIGWALREYAKVDPEAVRAFLDINHERLSGLSLREASKHLG